MTARVALVVALVALWRLLLVERVLRDARRAAKEAEAAASEARGESHGLRELVDALQLLANDLTESAQVHEQHAAEVVALHERQIEGLQSWLAAAQREMRSHRPISTEAVRHA